MYTENKDKFKSMAGILVSQMFLTEIQFSLLKEKYYRKPNLKFVEKHATHLVYADDLTRSMLG